MKISFNEVIGNWLKREYLSKNYKKDITQIYEKCIDKHILLDKIINEPDYYDENENFIRKKIINCYRKPLINGMERYEWNKIILSYKNFTQLYVIKAWMCYIKGKPTLINVANNIMEKNFSSDFKNNYEIIISIIKHNNIDTNFILVKNPNNNKVTIIEGNKSAVALMIRSELLKNLCYIPIENYIGIMDKEHCFAW